MENLNPHLCVFMFVWFFPVSHIVDISTSFSNLVISSKQCFFSLFKVTPCFGNTVQERLCYLVLKLLEFEFERERDKEIEREGERERERERYRGEG